MPKNTLADLWKWARLYTVLAFTLEGGPVLGNMLESICPTVTAHKVNQDFVLKEPTHKEGTERNGAVIRKLSSRFGDGSV